MAKAKKQIQDDTELFFISLREYGRVDGNKKLLTGIGFSAKRMVANADRPLLLVGQLINQMLPSMTYSSPEAAKTDMDAFKAFLATLKAK